MFDLMRRGKETNMNGSEGGKMSGARSRSSITRLKLSSTELTAGRRDVLVFVYDPGVGHFGRQCKMKQKRNSMVYKQA